MMVEEDDQNKQNQTPNPSQPVSSQSVGGGGGGAGPLSGGNPSGSNPSTVTPSATPQNQQQWGTIQDYLGANKDQGSQLATQVTDKLNTDLSGEKSAIDTSAANANSEVQSGTTNFNPDLVSEAVNKPTEVANDSGKLTDFLKQWNASYTGPSSFATSDTYTPAANALQESTQRAAETQDAGGQGVLLNQDFGVKGQGNQGLDVSLLENSPGYSNVQALTPQFQGIKDYLNTASNGVNVAATAGQQASDAAKAQTQGAFANELNTFQQSINNKTAADKAAATTQQAQYQKDLASGNIDAVTADLKAAGTPDSTITSITDYLKNLSTDYKQTPDLSNYAIANPNLDVTPATAASPEDYANAQAYAKLTGDTGYTTFLNPANAGEAGTANTVNGTINGTGIQEYLKGQLNSSDSSLLQKDLGPVKTLLDNNPNAVQNLVDAANRQGATYANSPALTSLMGSISGQLMTQNGAISTDDPAVVAANQVIQYLQKADPAGAKQAYSDAFGAISHKSGGGGGQSPLPWLTPLAPVIL